MLRSVGDGTFDDPRPFGIYGHAVSILVSDFDEGASPRRLLAACHRLHESGVRLLGLASLDEQAHSWYDRRMAERLQAHGMEIAALTPARLADWVVEAIQ